MKKFWIFSVVVIAAWATWYWYPNPAVDFSTQVKPIINKNCITCHGGVRRKSGFSLLFRQDALEPAESGKPAIIPGKPDESEMIRRLTLSDPDERMPFKHAPLSSEDIDILRQWIKEGAKWGDHWAYVPVKPVMIPTSPGSEITSWAKNEIDFLVADQWMEKKLKHSPEADKATILRRVSLDLTGLPPSQRIASEFLRDSSAKAYENLVDALLASPRYGERWAALWLDLARYADTKGYERDYTRSIWQYRDWLIRAFNENKPYDQFLTEQLAGDLLPNPTDDQLIATAFHRNTMTNDEGGTENEEFRTAAVLDRVNTTWEALMGTTFACTQCHSHPYDPFRHEDYYKFAAFFNNDRDEDTGADYPRLRTFVHEDSVQLLKLKEWITKNDSREKSNSIALFVKTWQPSINSLLADSFVNSALSDTKWLILRNHAVARLPHVDLTGSTQLIFRWMTWSPGGTMAIHLDKPSGPVLMKFQPTNTKDQWVINALRMAAAEGKHDLYFTYENPMLKSAGDNGIMFDWFYFTVDFPGKGRPGYDSAYASFWKLVNAKTETTPIMLENPPSMRRKSYVFERGNWLVKGKEVEPATPHSLLPFPKDVPANRLGLARWITSTEHPLTARTFVNRIWEQLFGTGLAETLEDLGTQGIPPTHPQLLDFLAWRFVNDQHWDMKALLKTIVMSATYRQDSRLTNELSDKDPGNKYFARGPRVRLTAEQVRDQTLAVSGLLSDKMYGPGVMPFQPKGIWNSPYNELSWTMSKGEDRFRRAIYTFWKRTNPYPSTILFDGMAREVCTARRIRTNTPLQALVTLNDSVYVEAAKNFALRIRREAQGDPQALIEKAYSIAMGKPIDAEKLKVLVGLYEKTSHSFQPASLKNQAGTYPALELVASVILNLDEFLTKN